MSLICNTYSHRNVPIAFREKVHFDRNSVANACLRFRCVTETPSSFVELSILSTCNRTEIFAYLKKDVSVAHAKAELLAFIQEARPVTHEELAEFGRWHQGPDAVEHLSRVACGLESLVLGEPQVLGQVGDAMRMGLIMNSAGPVLTRLFQSAIRCGRRARNETQINNHSLNIATVAVNTAKHRLESLNDRCVVVLGAGEMADLAVTQMRKLGATDIHVVNRTVEKANELALKHDGKAYVYEQIDNLLPKADVLISSTGAPHTLITREMIQTAMQLRPQKKLVILDIAVPRDVEQSAAELENVDLCDIDDLSITTGKSIKLRQEEIPKVEKIVAHEVDHYLSWFRTIGIESTVVSLRQKADEIRVNELGRLAKLLPNMDIDSWETLRKFSESLVNKILHDPTTMLREVQGTRAAIDHGEAVRQLFRLQTEFDADPELPTKAVSEVQSILDAVPPKAQGNSK